MKLRISGLLAIAAFVLLGSAQSLAQNAYITNHASGTVSVIDTTSDMVTTTINVGGFPYGVAVSPDGQKVYVTTSDGGSVQVIDTATNAGTAGIAVRGVAYGIAASPDGSKLYVVNEDSGIMSVIDTATNAVTTTINVGGFPQGVAVSPDGSKIYVTLTSGSTVEVFNAATNALTAIVLVSENPQGLAVTPDGSKVYVANLGDNNVSVIDTTTNAVIARIDITLPSDGELPVVEPHGVAVSPDGTKVYVTISGGIAFSNGVELRLDRVAVIDTATNTVIATTPVGSFPVGVSVTPDGRKVYVANSGDNNVSVIDTARNTVTTTIPVGGSPIAFGVFIQPPKPTLRFAGTPGKANCYGQSCLGVGPALWRAQCRGRSARVRQRGSTAKWHSGVLRGIA
jgi:YVTN family beta-propeller protein